MSKPIETTSVAFSKKEAALILEKLRLLEQSIAKLRRKAMKDLNEYSKG